MKIELPEFPGYTLDCPSNATSSQTLAFMRAVENRFRQLAASSPAPMECGLLMSALKPFALAAPYYTTGTAPVCYVLTETGIEGVITPLDLANARTVYQRIFPFWYQGEV